jgi:hypothetical protein
MLTLYLGYLDPHHLSLLSPSLYLKQFQHYIFIQVYEMKQYILLFSPLHLPSLLTLLLTFNRTIFYFYYHDIKLINFPFQWCIQDFFSILGLELRAYTLDHSTSPFLWKVFQDRVSQNYLPRLTSHLNPLDLCFLSS